MLKRWLCLSTKFTVVMPVGSKGLVGPLAEGGDLQINDDGRGWRWYVIVESLG